MGIVKTKECEHSGIRVVHSHEIKRDKKKPYSVYSHSEIWKGCCMCGSGTKVLNINGKFERLGVPNKLTMTKEEAEEKLKTLC